MKNSSSKIKNFITFNESSQDIDWSQFQDFLKRGEDHPEIVKNYKIDKEEIVDILHDIEDNIGLKSHSISQKFQISEDRTIKHTIRVILIVGNIKYHTVQSPSEQLKNLNLFQGLISEIDNIVERINSFFGVGLYRYQSPDSIMGNLNFILDFSRDVEDIDIIKKIYLDYLNKRSREVKIWDPIVPKEMAKSVIKAIIDHLAYNDVDTFDIENDPNEVKVEYHSGGRDVSGPGGFHIFIGGDMVTLESLGRGADPKKPYSYVDWHFVNTKFGLV